MTGRAAGAPLNPSPDRASRGRLPPDRPRLNGPRLDRSRLGRVPLVVVAAAVAGAALAGVVAATWLTMTAPVPGIVEPGPLVEFGVAVARLLVELGATGALGMALVPTLVGAGRASERAELFARADRLGLLAAVLWLGGALVTVLLQAAELRPGAPVTAAVVADYVRGFGSGQALLVSAAVAASCALAFLAGSRVPSLLRAVLAAAGLIPVVLAGHASSGTTPWHAMMADLLVLHVIAGAAWTGGLVAVLVLVAPRAALLAGALPRFSTLAGACLLTIAVTGALSATIELSTTPGVDLPGALVMSDYGLILSAKAACLLAVAAIGWRMRYRLLPAIVRRHRAALIGWGVCEVALLGLAFGLAVALSRSPVLGY